MTGKCNAFLFYNPPKIKLPLRMLPSQHPIWSKLCGHLAVTPIIIKFYAICMQQHYIFSLLKLRSKPVPPQKCPKASSIKTWFARVEVENLSGLHRTLTSTLLELIWMLTWPGLLVSVHYCWIGKNPQNHAPKFCGKSSIKGGDYSINT